MPLISKIQTVQSIFKENGLRGIARVAVQKLMPLENPAQPVSQGNDLVFRFATCDDLIRLMAKYPDYCFLGQDSNHSRQWGLKQMGTLFCAEKIKEIAPAKILEVGAGFNTFFEEHFSAGHEYWILDDTVGLCDEEKFNAAVKVRQNTHFVRSLLGSFNSDVPDNYFDLVFSISALEHVPLDKRTAVYEDMFRIVRPGGIIVHSIDMFRDNRWAEEEYEYLKNAGFLVTPSPDLAIRVRQGEGAATLFEPIDTVFKSYYGIGRKDMWTNLRSISGQVPTILVVARKPPVSG